MKNMRLNEARRRLSLNDNTIASVAQSLGFRSAQYFVKAFEWRFGVLPVDYKKRFPLSVTASPKPTRTRYKQRLLFASAADPAQFDVAASLRQDKKAKMLKRGNDIFSPERVGEVVAFGSSDATPSVSGWTMK